MVESRFRVGVKNNRGFVLITSLMFLIVLTIYVVSASRFATLSERIAGNTRSRTIAYYSADVALQRAVQVLTSFSGAPRTSDTSANNYMSSNTISTLPASFSAHKAVGNTKMLSCPLNATTSICLLSSEKNGPSITTGAAGSVTAQPQFLISQLASGTKDTGKRYYVITAIGYGVSANSTVVLQEIVTAY